MVTGSIVYADGASLAVVSLEDQFLSFSVVGDDIDKSEVKGISNGAEVDIFYTGTINGRDTSQVKVTKLAQTKQQAAVRTDVHLTGGTILESDGTILKVATYDGAELSFDVSDTEIDREGADGLVIGEKVAVFFEGEIVDNSTENVRVVKLVQ